MILLDDFSQLQLHGGMAACSYTSWWFLTTSTSVEAIFQSYTLPYNHHANFESCTLPIISLTSNPPLLVTKTSQNFQSYTLPILSQSHKNFLRKLLKSSNPPLLVTQSYENFLRKLPILHFWLRNLTKTSDENFQSSRNLTETSQNFQTSTLFQSSTFGYAILRKLLTKTSQNFLRKLLKTSNPPLLVMKTSYQNFSKLPILHFSLRKLPIPPVFVTKTSDSSTFGYENSSRKLLIPRLWLQKLKTSNSSTFGYENLKLPILSQTSDSSNLKTWKTLPSSYNFQSSPTWTFL